MRHDPLARANNQLESGERCEPARHLHAGRRRNLLIKLDVRNEQLVKIRRPLTL
jgi:hypothetical protein